VTTCYRLAMSVLELREYDTRVASGRWSCAECSVISRCPGRWRGQLLEVNDGVDL